MKSTLLSLVVFALSLTLLASPASATTMQDLIDWVASLFDGTQAGDATSPTGAWEPRVITCWYTDLNGEQKQGTQIACVPGSGSCSATLCS